MRSEPSPTRSRTRGQRTATGPMPVTISRSGRCPWRTRRRRPSSVTSSTCLSSKVATSASTARARSVRAPLRNTSVSGSAKVPGWENWKTLVSVMAYLPSMESGGVEHPHDTPPHPFMPSPTFKYSSVRCGLIEDVRVAQLAARVAIEEHLIEGEEAMMLEGGLLEHLVRGLTHLPGRAWGMH